MAILFFFHNNLFSAALPSRRDQFIEYAQKAFADWKKSYPA